jgi:hypothetical protein
MESATSAVWSLLPLGRRWPEGPDEGAFWTAVAPHQFGQMTYGRVMDVEAVASPQNAPVSHGLTSSPPRGEGKRGAQSPCRTIPERDEL